MSKLLKHMNNVNSKWSLQPIPGDAEGVQISFTKSISEHIEQLSSMGIIKPGEMVRVKISGDGTNIGKRLSVINITYTILNEKQLAMSEKGNYLLAVIKASESYETLSTSLSDLIKEMEQLNEVHVDNNIYPLEYFLGGNWKFLACVCGIGAANADYACIWCKCPKLKRYDTEQTWSVLEPASGARTL